MVSTKEVIALFIVAIVIISGFFAAVLYYQSNVLSSSIASIKQSFLAVQSNLSMVNNAVNEVRSSISSTNEKLSKLESKVAHIEDALANVNKSIDITWSKLNELNRLLFTVATNVSKVSLKYSKLERSLIMLKEYVTSLKYPMAVTDALGRQVIITHEPERIVSAAPSITEILFAIGAGDKVVGVDEYSNYPPVVRELVKNGTIEVIGGFSTINIEKIALLRPDVVFLTTGIQEKFIKELASMGITVYVLSDKSIEDVFTDILVIGVIVNKADNAVKLVEELKARLMKTYLIVHEYLNKTNTQTLKVYFEVYPDYWTIGRDSFINDIIVLAGGKNIFSDVETPYFPASPEEIIIRNPDVILTTAMYGSFGPPENLVDRIKSREGWSNITSVKEGRIYVFKGALEDIMVRPGPRVVIAVEVLARVLYPRAFNISSIPNVIDDSVVKSWGIRLTDGVGELSCIMGSAPETVVLENT